MAFINPLASTAIMLLSYAPRTPDEIVADLKEVTRGPMMYPASVCDSVPFQMTVGLEAVTEITEDLSCTYKAEATITIAPQHEKACVEMLDGIKQSREAPTVKPRSKRGQRGRRWP